MSFKRSPSKVWWGSESLEFREVSSSPGSQDSGFSDSETSPQNNNNSGKERKPQKKEATIPEENNNDATTPTKIPNNSNQIAKNIFKISLNNCDTNLASNYKEKCTPVKENIDQRLVKSERKDSPNFLKKLSMIQAPFTEPTKRQRFLKHSPKVSRNLFAFDTKECLGAVPSNQYSNLTQNTNEEEPNENSTSSTLSEISGTKSVPLLKTTPQISTQRATQSAPDFEQLEAVTSFNYSTSSESELEQIFEDLEHTSTPKGSMTKERLQQRLHLRYQDQERVPPIHTDTRALQRWLQEARFSIEPECTTMLQCKSIAAELSQRVSQLASCTTTILRGLLSHSRCIEMDYKNLNSDSKQVSPLIQSLAGNILDFLKSHTLQVSSQNLRLYDQIRSSTVAENAMKPLRELYSQWESIQREILVQEIKKLVDKLEDPTSETDLRATLTGITSVALRNVDLIEHFVKADIIPILLILCEKCEGSSMRTLILRALSTMCSSSLAIRHFEKFSGVQIVADTLDEEARPEPERSEAVALLAQVTAPWLEDNHNLKGLQDYSKKLAKSLTKFSSTTKCCQNLLLCAAALANLSSMDTKSIKFLIQSNTASVLLSAVRNRGPLASIYLLEQVATLLANMAAIEEARLQLADADAPLALLHFLKAPRLCQNEDVERRLQQKSVIALSRLCGDVEAARQVVDCGGVKRLVELCREKRERFNSDAVLVAALATLRKIAEACGKDVLSLQDCQELVEPKLLDSFLTYSTQNESYV